MVTVTAVSKELVLTITVYTPDGTAFGRIPEVKVEALQLPETPLRSIRFGFMVRISSDIPPFIPVARDAAAMRFSSTRR